MSTTRLDLELDPDDLDKVLQLFVRHSEDSIGWAQLPVSQENWANKSLAALADAVPGVKGRVLVWVLSPGSERDWHADAKSCKRWEMGTADDQVTAIHIPLQTNKDAFFQDASGVTKMEVGEVWAVDITKNHRVVNDGDEARIHLLLDTYGSSELRDLLGADYCRAADEEEDVAEDGDDDGVSELASGGDAEECYDDEDSGDGGEGE